MFVPVSYEGLLRVYRLLGARRFLSQGSSWVLLYPRCQLSRLLEIAKLVNIWNTFL